MRAFERAKDIMHFKSIVTESRFPLSSSKPKQPEPPYATISRRELRRLVAEMVG